MSVGESEVKIVVLGLFSAGEDVYSCKEETDERFQEVAARSTCWHQWCSPRQ